MQMHNTLDLPRMSEPICSKPLGVLVADKPAGWSSARVVGHIKRLFARGTKVGHAGTLDPFATGVLLILVGPATKWAEALMGETKVYEATIKLGATTPTEDPTSDETVTSNIAPIALDAILATLPHFVGNILQRPSAFSALHVGGKRAYDLARRGEAFVLEPRPVRIDAIDILGYCWPFLEVRVVCGRGTYIRALARDIGQSLGVGGYLTQLRRTRVGPFEVADAVQPAVMTDQSVLAALRPYRFKTTDPT